MGLICVSVKIYQSPSSHQLLIDSPWHEIHLRSGYLGPEPYAVHVIHKFMETTSLCERTTKQYITSLVFDVATVSITSPLVSIVSLTGQVAKYFVWTIVVAWIRKRNLENEKNCKQRFTLIWKILLTQSSSTQAFFQRNS